MLKITHCELCEYQFRLEPAAFRTMNCEAKRAQAEQPPRFQYIAINPKDRAIRPPWLVEGGVGGKDITEVGLGMGVSAPSATNFCTELEKMRKPCQVAQAIAALDCLFDQVRNCCNSGRVVVDAFLGSCSVGSEYC